MIRTSGFVALVAVLVSLVLHGLGLSLTARDAPSQSFEQATSDVTDTGVAFEDFADTAAQADPPDVTPPDRIVEETPTSNALVASDSPQNTLVPDAAATSDAAPDTDEETEGVPDATDAEEQSGPDDETVGALAALQPDEMQAEDTNTETDRDVTEPDSSTTENPEVITPVVPDVFTEDFVKNLPDAETSEPETTDVIVASRPEEPEILTTDETEALSRSAVTRSLRPPAERPTTEALGATEYVQQQRQAQVIESPLDVFRRTGVDQLALGSLRGAAGATSFAGSGGAGNASVTNYVGRVLVQLNRFPVGKTSDSGTARVQFQINADGSLAWVRILRSSGSASVDRAATTQVRRAAPFPRPPTGTSQRLVFLYRNK